MYKKQETNQSFKKAKMKLFALFAALTKALPAYNEVADLAAAPNATEAIKVIEERMADLLQQQDELNLRHQEVTLKIYFLFNNVFSSAKMMSTQISRDSAGKSGAPSGRILELNGRLLDKCGPKLTGLKLRV